MTSLSQMQDRKGMTGECLDSRMANTASGGMPTKLLYLLVGSGIGAAIGLIFAPKAGAALRSDISEITRTGYDETLDLAHNVKEHTADLAQNVKEHSADIYQTVKEKADRIYGLAAEKLAPIQDVTIGNMIGEPGNVTGEVLQLDEKMRTQKPHNRSKGSDIM